MPAPGNEVLELLRKLGPELHTLLTRITLREDAAEDLLQELYIRLSGSFFFRRAANPGAYARRAAIHLAFDWRRSRRRHPEGDGLPEGLSSPGTSSPLRSLIEREELEQIVDALSQLNSLRREVFVMHYFQQESYEGIAAHMGKTPHQIRGICSKAVEQVRATVEKQIGAGSR